MLILCDFDGTLFEPDVTNAIWDKYGIPQWRDVDCTRANTWKRPPLSIPRGFSTDWE